MNKLKVIFFIIFILLVTVILTACGKNEDEAESTALPADIMKKIDVAVLEKEIIDGVVYLESGKYYTSGSETEGEYLSESQISQIYGDLEGPPDFTAVESYAVWLASGDVVTEMGVFKVKDIESTEIVKKFLNERVRNLILISKDYKPEEVAKAEKAVVSSNGKYVYYLVTNINGVLEDIIKTEIEAGKSK